MPNGTATDAGTARARRTTATSSCPRPDPNERTAVTLNSTALADALGWMVNVPLARPVS